MSKTLTVLVVGEDSSSRYAKTKLLERQGYHVLSASSGQETLSLGNSSPAQVVLLDVQLPDMDGFEACRRLKGDPTSRKPMVLLSLATNAEAMDRLKALECGADAYLVEPAEDEELLATVRALIRSAEREQENQRLMDTLALAQRVSKSGVWDWHIAENRLPYVSAEYKELYGLPADEPVTYEQWLTCVHPDDRYRVTEYGRRFFAGRDTEYGIEFRIIHPQRGERWIAGIGHLARSAGDDPVRFTGINLDITARKLADQELQQRESELQERERRLRIALAAGKMGTWDVDLKTQRSKWDTKQLELFGFSKQAAAPSLETFLGCVHPEDRAGVKAALAAVIRSAGELETEFRIVRPDGQVRWLVGRGLAMTDENGRPHRIVGINYDVTDRKVTEEQLRSIAQELDIRVTARTQELVASQKRLRALAAELNLAEQRERKRIAGELHDHLQQMLVLSKLKLGQGKRLAKPISACAKLVEEADSVLTDALQYTRTLVAELCPPVLRDQGLPAGLLWLRDYMKKHDCIVTVALPDVITWNISQNDAVLLFQSTRELLINSSKYAGTRAAWVTVKESEGLLEIEVRDDGAGFDPAYKEKRAEAESSQFGLYSIHERMTALGGSFQIQSAPGKGTRAILRLPLEEKEELTIILRSEHPLQHTQMSSLSLIRVLIADDHAMVRQGIRTLLEGYADIEVAGEAANGQEALMLVEKLRPEVVVMDVNMPIMDGIEATAHIKQLHPDMTIIGISVNAEENVQQDMKRVGGARLITKEAAVDDLYGAIQEARASGGPAS